MANLLTSSASAPAPARERPTEAPEPGPPWAADRPGPPTPRTSHPRAAWRANVGERWAALTSRSWFDGALIVALAALALGLRWRTLWTSYWGDEAIAIGIAAHPISSLPRYLVNDGSPPLYYVMLHFWMRLFGRSEPATHVLSLVPSLLAIPAAWWSAGRLFGRRAARYAAALLATCAYLDYYSTETRMYSWLVLVAILALTFFVLAYRGAGARYWVGATALMAAVLYLQYYGLYLLAATVAVGLVLARTSRSVPRLRSTLIYGAVCAAAFAPWAPQFVYQLRHTGAPWAPHPSVLDFFGDSFNAVASAAWGGIALCIAVSVLGRQHLSGDGQSWLRASPLALAAAVPAGTLVIAWGAAQFINSWNPRYLGIAVVPALIPLSGALARARWGAFALVVAVTALASTALPMLVDRSVTVITAKSDAAYLLAELKPELHRGALIISSEVTDTPVFALDLGPGYHYATPFGLLKDPLVVNWSNLPTRLQGINAANKLAPVLATVPVGGQVLIVNPTSWGGGETPERYASSVEAEAIAANEALLTDPQLKEVLTEEVPPYSNPLYPMLARLFVKV